MKGKKWKAAAGILLSVSLFTRSLYAQETFSEVVPEEMTEAGVEGAEENVSDGGLFTEEIPEEVPVFLPGEVSMPVEEVLPLEEPIFTEEELSPDITGSVEDPVEESWFSLEELISMTGFGEAVHIGTEEFPMVLSEAENFSASSEREGIEADGLTASLTDGAVLYTTDGMAPWDGNLSPGNDTDSVNRIVRSFDTVEYKMSYSVRIRPGEFLAFQKADLFFRAEVPDMTLQEITFDLDAMKWLLDARVFEENGSVILEGRRHLERADGGNAVPGAGTLSVVEKVLGSANGKKIRPRFSLWLKENRKEAMSFQGPEITVTASPQVNIHLAEPEYTDTPVYVDFSTGRVSKEAFQGGTCGYLIRQGILLELQNRTKGKGFKGLETIQNPISFLVKADSTGKTGNGTASEQLSTPVLWDCGRNDRTIARGTKNRDATGGGAFLPNLTRLPYAALWGDTDEIRNSCCFESGQWTASETEKGILVTIDGYATGFGSYPSWSMGPSVRMPGDFGYGIGLSSGYVIFFQELSKAASETQTVVTSIRDFSLQAVSASGNALATAQGAENQVNQSDDVRTVSNVRTVTSSFQKYTLLGGVDGNGTVSGLGILGKGDKVRLEYKILSQNREDLHSMDVLVKFEDAGFDLLSSEDTFFVRDGSNFYPEYTDLSYTIRYAAKKDRSGWTNEQEMQRTIRDELVYFDSVSALSQAGYTCIGYLVQIRGEIGADQNGNGTKKPCELSGGITAVIGTSAVSGRVYSCVTDVYAWKERVETLGNRQTSTAGLPSVSTADVFLVNGRNAEYPYYQKTVYDNSGRIVSGSNNSSSTLGGALGTSVLVTETVTKITRSIPGKEWDPENPPIFDVSGGYRTVFFAVTPSVSRISDAGCVVTVTDTLPEKLFYVSGSAVFSGTYTENSGIQGGKKSWKQTQAEPVVTGNSKGDTILTWTFSVEKGESLPQILYETVLGSDEMELQDISDQEKLTSYSVISSAADTRVGEESILGRQASVELIAVRPSGAYIKLYLPEEDESVDADSPISCRIEASNFHSTTYFSGIEMINPLPANGDDRGSSFTGTYDVQTSKEKNAQKGITLTGYRFRADTWNNITIYSSADMQNWKKESRISKTGDTATYSISSGSVAWKLVGKIPYSAGITIDYVLVPKGNQALDRYRNDVWVNVLDCPIQMRSAIVETVVRDGAVKSLTIEKTIDMDAVFASHGSPVFQFQITPITGGTASRNVTIVFPKSGSGMLTKRVTILDLPAGLYRVKELETMRYRCEDPVREIVLDGENQTISFTNLLTTEAGESHTACVKNHVDLETMQIRAKEEE